MYSLDINFLNDRPEYKTRVIKPPKGAAGKPVDQTPILIGLGVAVGLNALMGGGWFVLTRQNASLSREADALELQLGEKNVQVQALDRIYAEAKQTNDEADALALVFNEIKPWSALSQEMAKIMQIAGVRITNLRQTDPPTKQLPPLRKRDRPLLDKPHKLPLKEMLVLLGSLMISCCWSTSRLSLMAAQPG
ncbi:fimbrial assembly protein [Limnospira indica]|uniref:fimbrial assembly protein n=1 Tax=Limnospira indica TaxID=147322 RepID=UPI002356B0AA|nr:fimbrial assembly protein [Limnospira indica]